LRKGIVHAIDATSRTAFTVPRVDRVPPLRCSQFAAPIWLLGHSERRLHRKVRPAAISLARDASSVKNTRD
jgi:hypothetical protein